MIDVDDVVVALVNLARRVYCCVTVCHSFITFNCPFKVFSIVNNLKLWTRIWCQYYFAFFIVFEMQGEVEESTKKKEIKNFRGNLVSFWDNLVIECQNGPLFDTVLFEKCMDYIIALSW